MLRAVAGLVEVASGQILLDGQDILPIPLCKRLESGIGYVPEDRKLFKEMTVKENIEVARIGVSPSQRREMNIDELLPELASLYKKEEQAFKWRATETSQYCQGYCHLSQCLVI